MAILFTDERGHCIWRVKGGPKGLFPMKQLTNGFGSHHKIIAENWEPLLSSRWNRPTGICEIEYECFLVVDCGNKALRVIDQCKSANARVGLLEIIEPNLMNFEFNPLFVDCHENTIRMFANEYIRIITKINICLF